MGKYRWEENILFENGLRIGSLISKPACINENIVNKYEISTLEYMSSWDGIYFDDFQEAKKETERVISERKLYFNGFMFEAIELNNGNIVFRA